MLKIRESKIYRLVWPLFLSLCVGLFCTACNFPADERSVEEDTGISETSTPALSGADVQEDTSGSEDLSLWECPAYDTVVPVDYIHWMQTNVEGTFFKFQGHDTFQLTIRSNGVIESEDFENRTTLAITGKFEGCPVHGESGLYAEFEGTCIDGVIDMFIVERLKNVIMIQECPGEEPKVIEEPGYFSAPEDHIQFKPIDGPYLHEIRLETPTNSINYMWTFEFSALNVIPLVPQ